MPWLAEFFRANLEVVLFLHGLALFSMGLALALEMPRGQPESALRRVLPYLVCSAFLLAAGAWAELPLLADEVQTGWASAITLRVVALAGGAFCLLEFGVNLIAKARQNLRWLRWLPVALLAGWLVAALLQLSADPSTGAASLTRVDTWARYALLLPGGIVAGLGLREQGRQLGARGLARVDRDWRYAGAALALSGLVGSAMTPTDGVFSASIIGRDYLLAAAGIPSALVLAVLGAAAGFLLVGGLRGIDGERQKREASLEENLRSQQALLEAERRRCQELEAINADLVQANEAKTKFLAIAAHDLKSPLAATQSYLHVLLGGFTGELKPKQREMLERSSDRIQDLLALIGDLLDATRIESGQLVGEKLPVELNEVVRTSVENVRLPIAHKGIRLDISMPEQGCCVLASKHRLQQLFTNLLSNAVKYTPEMGCVSLTVEERGEAVCIEVADNGPGIPPEALPHIFEEFYKVDSADGRRNLGLGLFIAKKIVEAHGGEIWAESPCADTGQGTRFFVKLPRLGL
ncbi:MAG: ATP-binding protein [Chloroflexota bacterium]